MTVSFPGKIFIRINGKFEVILPKRQVNMTENYRLTVEIIICKITVISRNIKKNSANYLRR